jgi:hemoglobin
MNFLRNLILRFRPTPYQRIGGKKRLGQIVEDFYGIMESDPRARECQLTHTGLDQRASAEKLLFFLSGWLGGPQLYAEKYGHPRLRMRHFPFAIGEKEAEQWLFCMDLALQKNQVAEPQRTELMTAFKHLTELIKNH